MKEKYLMDLLEESKNIQRIVVRTWFLRKLTELSLQTVTVKQYST